MAWTSQRVDIKYDEFAKLIYQKGYWVTWEKSSICPCIKKDGQGQPDFNCPLCLGKGRYWFDPKKIQGIMMNFNTQERFNPTGEIISGASYFTTFPENKLGFWDRLTNLNSKIRYSEVIIKGTHGGKDRLRFKPVDILSLRTVSTPYTEKIDFDYVSSEQYIDWSVDGLEPETGEQYSVEFYTNPRWICIDMVTVIRDTLVKRKKPGVQFVELPVRATVRLEFFV